MYEEFFPPHFKRFEKKGEDKRKHFSMVHGKYILT